MGVFLKHEPCPKCGSRDNLARYRDGSAWCFGGCGYKERANRIPVVSEKPSETSEIVLDRDLCSDFPLHVVEWLAKYGIRVDEALKHGWLYGPGRDQLVFVFKDEHGTPILSQARNFSPNAKRKYFNQGSAEDVLHIYSGTIRSGEMVCVVEDVLSAAKVGRQYDCLPVLGSHFSNRKLSLLKLLGYVTLVMWLDSNKLNESRKIAERAKWLGFDTRVIYTELDPKEYKDEEIQWQLNSVLL